MLKMKETDCEGNENKAIGGKAADYWTGQGSLMSNINNSSPFSVKCKTQRFGSTKITVSIREHGYGPTRIKMEPPNGDLVILTDKVRLR